MINVQASAEAQAIVVPRNTRLDVEGGLTLRLVGIGTHKRYDIEASTEKIGAVNYFLRCVIDVPAAEYQYELSDEQRLLAAGLMIVGKPRRDKEQFEDNKTYKEYNG